MHCMNNIRCAMYIYICIPLTYSLMADLLHTTHSPGCFLFHGDHRDLEECPNCNTDRYQHLRASLHSEPCAGREAWANQRMKRDRIPEENRVIHWSFQAYFTAMFANPAIAQAFEWPGSRPTHPGISYCVHDGLLMAEIESFLEGLPITRKGFTIRYVYFIHTGDSYA
jgi:hypothetical protein